MKMKTCKCGKQVASNARSCPSCGYRFTNPLVQGMAVLFAMVTGMAILGVILSSNAPQPGQPSNYPTAPSAPTEVGGYSVDAQGRRTYAADLEKHLLSIGLDAHVRTIGKGRDILRISWAGMSRPIVYKMMNDEGMQKQVPALGFKKVIFTDDGSFSGGTPETWAYTFSK